MEQPSAVFAGSYELLAELGRGTTGTVYEARHTRLNRRVALKVPQLAPEAERPTRAGRFLMECQALACLTGGPACNIPRLLDVAESPTGCRFSVRELVDGSTLEQRAAQGSIDLRTGLAVIAEVARVVQWAHEQGFAHRNLSPANVLVARDDTPWLVGFGRVGLVAGSRWLLPEAPGAPAEADVRGLRGLLGWLCGALRQPVPQGVPDATAPSSILTARAFGEAVASHL